MLPFPGFIIHIESGCKSVTYLQWKQVKIEHMPVEISNRRIIQQLKKH